MDIYTEILEERRRQDAKWGEQNHPSLASFDNAEATCRHYNIPTEQEAKDTCDDCAQQGTVTWGDIALEEVSEVFSAFHDSEDSARGELVQLAAVVVSWIECLDRRAGKARLRPFESNKDLGRGA